MEKWLQIVFYDIFIFSRHSFAVQLVMMSTSTIPVVKTSCMRQVVMTRCILSFAMPSNWCSMFMAKRRGVRWPHTFTLPAEYKVRRLLMLYVVLRCRLLHRLVLYIIYFRQN